MAVTIFLWITGIGWLGYGLYCFVMPTMLTEVVGLAPINGTAVVEMRAMYGGLQAAVGVLAILGATRSSRAGGVLLALCCLYAGLSSARAIGGLMEGEFSSYTIGALIFEAGSALLCLWLMRRAAAA